MKEIDKNPELVKYLKSLRVVRGSTGRVMDKYTDIAMGSSSSGHRAPSIYSSFYKNDKGFLVPKEETAEKHKAVYDDVLRKEFKMTKNFPGRLNNKRHFCFIIIKKNQAQLEDI